MKIAPLPPIARPRYDAPEHEAVRGAAFVLGQHLHGEARRSRMSRIAANTLWIMMRIVSSFRFVPGSMRMTTPSVSVISVCAVTIQKRRGPKRTGRTRSTSGAHAHLSPHGA